MIIVTPYLVRPTSGQLALPTDGYRAPTDVQRVFEGQTFTGRSGPPAPAVVGTPTAAAPVAADPGIQAVIRRLQRKDAMMRSKLGFVLLATALAGCSHVPYDEPSRGVAAVNVPVLTRAEYVFDAAAPDGSLSPVGKRPPRRLVPLARPWLRRFDLCRRRLCRRGARRCRPDRRPLWPAAQRWRPGHRRCGRARHGSRRRQPHRARRCRTAPIGASRRSPISPTAACRTRAAR